MPVDHNFFAKLNLDCIVVKRIVEMHFSLYFAVIYNVTHIITYQRSSIYSTVCRVSVHTQHCECIHLDNVKLNSLV